VYGHLVVHGGVPPLARVRARTGASPPTYRAGFEPICDLASLGALPPPLFVA
ncbi:hypothetical protein C8R44DRAFT_809703, partial [Mycena epipterygia]